MSQPAQRAEPPADQTAEDAQYYRRVLHALIDMGTEIAQSIHQQATAEPGAPTPDLTAPFERIARTIRRTILLARKVAEPLPKPQPDRIAARKRIIREVEDAIQGEAWMEKNIDVPALQAEFLDRLDSPDLDEEIDLRAVPDIVKDILRDLGLAHIEGLHHPWKRRTPADVEQLRTKAAEPFAKFRGSGVPDPPLRHSGLRAEPFLKAKPP